MAAGITYVPPLLLEAGVEERYMTMVLGEDFVKAERGDLVTSIMVYTVCVYVQDVHVLMLRLCCVVSQTRTQPLSSFSPV